MEEMALGQIQQALREADLASLPGLNLAVLRNVTLEPIKPYLEYQAWRMGFAAQVRFGQFDNVFQEAVGGAPALLGQQTDCVLVFLYLEALSADLGPRFNALSPAQVEDERRRVQDLCDQILAGLRRQTKAMILMHALEAPLYPSLGIVDAQRAQGQAGVVTALNQHLRDQLGQTPNAYLVDMGACLAQVGAEAFYDRRYWHIGRAPYARPALQRIAQEDFKFIRALKGKNKKCLVLDCDNTLWGGIIGEDGLNGIKLGKNYPGSAFSEFQQEIVSLYQRGIIIALCSKNNEADVWEVFEKHRGMVLRPEHIAIAKINWQDKAANLRQIALDLNIGLDSLVFLDDSPFEVELIRQEAPEVTVIALPKDNPSRYRQVLASCGLFDTLTISAEDKERGAMYRAEAGRKSLQSQATDLESYYRSLEMVVQLRLAEAATVPRIAQQTQKTNQFNLTTRRYSEADILELAHSPQADVLSLRLLDRFGDSGIVGTCILRYQGEQALIDTFLLSCRVLGRRVEEAFLMQALELARRRGASLAVGEFIATKKNQQVEDFYARMGFAEQPPRPGADRVFHLNLVEAQLRGPDCFKDIDAELD